MRKKKIVGNNSNNKLTNKNGDKLKRIKISLIFTVIALVIFYICYPIINGDFVWDDKLHILNNTDISDNGLLGVLNVFRPTDKYMYHPITILSYKLDYLISGYNTTSYHLTNIIIHIIVTILVYMVTYKVMKNIYISLFVSLFFCFHWMHVEPVAWISGRKDLLAGLFFFSSLLTYILYKEKNNSRYYLFSLLLILLGMLSKPSVAGLPFVLLLYDYYKKGKIIKKDILLILPFIFIVFLILLIPFSFDKSLSAINNLTNIYPLKDRIFFPSAVFSYYLVKIILFKNLTAFSGFPEKTGGILPIWYYFSLLVYLFFVLLIYRSVKTRRLVVFGILFYIVNLLIVSHLIPFGTSIFADRYTYIPYVGIFLLMGYFIDEKIKKDKIKYFLLGIFVVFMVFVFKDRVKIWRDNLSLWTSVIENGSNSKSMAYAYYNRGVEYENIDVNKAINDYSKCIELDSLYKDVYINRGRLYYNMNKNEEALKDFNMAVRVDRNDKAYNNRGSVLMRYGLNEEALKDFNMALKINQMSVETYNNRGILYVSMGKMKDAIDDYNRAEKIDSLYSQTYNNRAIAYFKLGMIDSAMYDWNKSIKLNPNNYKAYYNMGQAYFNLKRYNDAIRCYNKVLHINNNYEEARYWKNIAEKELVSNK